ncbi:RDD family protein [compost metagenome]
MEETSYFVPSTWARLIAKFIDQMISLVFYLPFAKGLYLLIFTDDDVTISLWQVLVLLLIPAVYEGVFLALMQRTPGKWIMGLKVVPARDVSAPLRWDQCLLRPLTERLSIFFSLAPFALAFFRYDRTHLADWVAETRVIQFEPRSSRTKIRWIVGTLLVVMNAYEGMSSAARVLNNVDWENGQVDVRALMDLQEPMDMEM